MFFFLKRLYLFCYHKHRYLDKFTNYHTAPDFRRSLPVFDPSPPSAVLPIRYIIRFAPDFIVINSTQSFAVSVWDVCCSPWQLNAMAGVSERKPPCLMCVPSSLHSLKHFAELLKWKWMKQVSRRRHMSQNFTQPAISSLLLTFASCLIHFPSCLHTADCVPASFHPSSSSFWRSAWQWWLPVWTWGYFYTLEDIVYVDFIMFYFEPWI